jgi:hypothetical protein
MFQRSLPPLVVACLILVSAASAAAAPPWWTDEAPTLARSTAADDLARTYSTFGVDATAFRQQLTAAPKSYNGAAGIEFLLPDPDGEPQRFRVVEDPVLAPELAARRPDIRTYSGVGLDDPYARVRFGISDQGVHARVRTVNGSWTMDNLRELGPELAVAWWDRDAAPRRFACGTGDEQILSQLPEPGVDLERRLGTQLRTYRFAITATGEFTTQAGGVRNTESIMATLVNLMNTLYINEFSVRFELVFMNVYTDAATDPFLTGNVLNGTLLLENDRALDAEIGTNAYDLGHIISVNPGSPAGGLAFVGVQCNSSFKGGGGTLLGSASTGAVYPIMIHEIGHQLGSSHSFNSEQDGCNGNRSASWAYEIGSGVTIMSYAGLCGAENVLNDDIDFFNAGSQQQITNRIIATSSCGTTEFTGNSLPTIDLLPTLSIPRETAFELTANVTDPDGDDLTYSWEQYDLGPASPPVDPADGPAFRNFEPGPEPSRSFPRYSAYRRGSITPWEFLPTVDRQMTFRLVVRDNNPDSGAVVWSTQFINVSGEPFRVLSPNGGESFEAGTEIDITWDVGGSVTDDVRILTSADGGVTWTEAVAATPNDGQATILSPCAATDQGRIRIEGVGNVFFDISDDDFTTTPETTPPVVECPATFTVTTDDETGLTNDDPALQPFFDAVTATDNCDGSLTPEFLLPPTLSIGENNVASAATDAAGNDEICVTTLTVELDTATNAPNAGLTRTGFVSVAPNPFNPRATIRFDLARSQNARLDVIDARGRRIDTLTRGTRSAGRHELVWTGTDADGDQVPSGVYFLVLQTDDGRFTERAVLLK